ncbi:iron chelate uptake ABC transporter family permease subunit [Actinokineospora soli]|uniref:Iron chelate uptake ABC transporter family permease subunit n=1 Tax=Actinokineospora soli TaxID=1048753 RepID=A0ABW2TTA5_9PSEU
MLGDRLVLLGDLVNWVNGATGPALTFVLDQRLPRVLAALAAGAALAAAGCGVQSVCRNPWPNRACSASPRARASARSP